MEHCWKEGENLKALSQQRRSDSPEVCVHAFTRSLVLWCTNTDVACLRQRPRCLVHSWFKKLRCVTLQKWSLDSSPEGNLVSGMELSHPASWIQCFQLSTLTGRCFLIPWLSACPSVHLQLYFIFFILWINLKRAFREGQEIIFTDLTELSHLSNKMWMRMN